MSEYYTDYVWRGGIPYGVGKMPAAEGRCYKVPMDPYRKRVAVEEYEGCIFQRVVYDSALLDFRLLKPPAEQTAWQKSVISSGADAVVSEIRNQDDRLICVETCYFREGVCVECRISSPFGIPLSVHRMFYRSKGDSFDGVVLYDINDHPIMFKKYEVDAESGEFTTLIEEQWEMSVQAAGATSL